MDPLQRHQSRQNRLYGHLGADDGPTSAAYSSQNPSEPSYPKLQDPRSPGDSFRPASSAKIDRLDDSISASSDHTGRSLSGEYTRVEHTETSNHNVERLISIDHGHSSDLLVPPLCETEAELQAQITKLQAKSTQKFVSAWERILQKYSSIDDDKESDEIDLATGEIVTDNGHLRSLVSQNASFGDVRLDKSIWSGEYNPQKDLINQRVAEKQRQRLKQAARTELKRKLLFYNTAALSSPERDEVRPDNLVLLSPSPTKKQRVSSVKTTASQSDILADSTDNSPTKLHLSSLSLGGFFRLSTPFGDPETYEGPLERSFDGSPIKKSNLSLHNLHSQDEDSAGSQLDSALEVSFEEEYLFTSEIYAAAEDTSRYTCAFDNCGLQSTTKRRYERHLLEEHTRELYNLGYPVSLAELVDIPVSETEKGLLTSVFPLVYDVPQLPLSTDGGPFACKYEVGKGRKCQKTFVSAVALKEHRRQYPSKCSYKKQVRLCPLLGCGFMTDEGYLQWRQHFVDEKHHIDPRFKRNKMLSRQVAPVTTKSRSFQPTKEDIADEIDAIFSDNTSSPLAEHDDTEDQQDNCDGTSDLSKSGDTPYKGDFTAEVPVIPSIEKNTFTPLVAPRGFCPRPILHDVPKLSLEPVAAVEKEVFANDDDDYNSIDELFSD